MFISSAVWYFHLTVNIGGFRQAKRADAMQIKKGRRKIPSTLLSLAVIVFNYFIKTNFLLMLLAPALISI